MLKASNVDGARQEGKAVIMRAPSGRRESGKLKRKNMEQRETLKIEV